MRLKSGTSELKTFRHTTSRPRPFLCSVTQLWPSLPKPLYLERDERVYNPSPFLCSSFPPKSPPSSQNAMGIFQDEAFTDALKLALAARLLSPSTSTPYHAFPGQVPIVFPAPPTCYDPMNPTTTKPFTILDPYLSHYNSIKTLRPSYVAVPLYAIVPLHILQVQTPPPQSIPSPHPTESAFWNVVERTVEHSVRGATALAWLLSGTAKAVPQKVRNARISFLSRKCRLITRFTGPSSPPR